MSNENIKITLQERRLYLFKGDVLYRGYPIAIGKPVTPTPIGEFAIYEKVINPGGILGSRWLGFYLVQDGKYGIHGTVRPELIGQQVSLGCVRMFDADIEEVFPMVSIGTKVTITTSLGVQLPGTTIIPGDKTYTVVVGDSLWKISKRLGVDLAQLIAINKLTEPYTIYPGQTLLLP